MHVKYLLFDRIADSKIGHRQLSPSMLVFTRCSPVLSGIHPYASYSLLRTQTNAEYDWDSRMRGAGKAGG
jgi:hypothetical protein